MDSIRDIVWAEDADAGIRHLPTMQQSELVCALTTRLQGGIPRDAELYDDGHFLLEYSTAHLECVVLGERQEDVLLIRQVDLSHKDSASNAGFYVRGVRWWRRAGRRLASAVAAARAAWRREDAPPSREGVPDKTLPIPAGRYRGSGADGDTPK